MMKGVADPGGAESVRREGLVVLAPDFFILERVGLSEFASQIPCQWEYLSAFLHILYDDRQVSLFAQ